MACRFVGLFNWNWNIKTSNGDVKNKLNDIMSLLYKWGWRSSVIKTIIDGIVLASIIALSKHSS
jgi:hypothetical protein